MTALIELLNNNECTRRYGTFSALDETTVQLVTSSSFEQSFCSDGILSFEILQDKRFLICSHNFLFNIQNIHIFLMERSLRVHLLSFTFTSY